VTQHFTFAVCIACGVQSPPVILPPAGPKDIAEPLKGMGWQFERLRFNVLATCPACQKAKDEAVENLQRT
jgi:hypothetical protein